MEIWVDACIQELFLLGHWASDALELHPEPQKRNFLQDLIVQRVRSHSILVWTVTSCLKK
jgi:hypothetical protein